jgi:hypothetical protein
MDQFVMAAATPELRDGALSDVLSRTSPRTVMQRQGARVGFVGDIVSQSPVIMTVASAARRSAAPALSEASQQGEVARVGGNVFGRSTNRIAARRT